MQLIQLWAAICLLFFYAPIGFLKDSPFKQKISILTKDVRDFVAQHDVVSQFGSIQIYDPTRWRDYVKRIKNMTAMSFFYCVFLLFYVGVQKSWDSFYPISHPSFLLISDGIVVFYLIIFSFINHKSIIPYIPPTICFVMIFVIFLSFEEFHNLIEEFQQLIGSNIHLTHKKSWPTVTLITLGVCIFSMLIILIRIWRDYVIINGQLKTLHSLNNKLNRLENTIFRLKVDEYSELDSISKEIISPQIKIDDSVFKSKTKKSKIIDQINNMNETDSLFVELSLRHNIIDKTVTELQTTKSYNELTPETQKIVRPICVNLNYFIWDKEKIIDNISTETSELIDTFQKKFKKIFVELKQDNQGIQNNQGEQDNKGIQSNQGIQNNQVNQENQSNQNDETENNKKNKK